MKWVTVKETHINASTINCIRWQDGRLYIWFVGDAESTHWEDPSREVYLKLCHDLQIIALRGEPNETV